MLNVELPTALEKRLEIVARKTGRTKHDVVVAAIVEQIQDLEDGLIALERLNDDKGDWLSLAEVKERLGLDDASDRSNG
ncbi:CopG family transcriptional regulator [Mesorhizobium sp.]|jgi:RHH-type rel operon transcriptional repressor/antitoxin RelB|uniref:type II toxin-antitoxin system RelB family antitoxin n=1 Tax=Mesorhizobium sp. TaxID=1871066 RepID=UPI0012104E03|nr:CopG family transcriptional regulator [Mesorhizobium sp.]TIL36065.1 MAG: anti-toxin [Mesorhizobium sp.]TIL42723.1 MAG: anti-toxin [Mesorhizobium sp.]TIL51675.1 MAG: anti-toxin [Mesorhizobium sp.]TIL59337.1 MAG: anti-toxin [Mesorhizobium sp.]TIL93162.1 MAG: anti-toxin [Mesorhizobium sp.]